MPNITLAGVLKLASQKKSLRLKGKQIPAAFVASMQLRYVDMQIKNGALKK